MINFVTSKTENLIVNFHKVNLKSWVLIKLSLINTEVRYSRVINHFTFQRHVYTANIQGPNMNQSLYSQI